MCQLKKIFLLVVLLYGSTTFSYHLKKLNSHNLVAHDLDIQRDLPAGNGKTILLNSNLVKNDMLGSGLRRKRESNDSSLNEVELTTKKRRRVKRLRKRRSTTTTEDPTTTTSVEDIPKEPIVEEEEVKEEDKDHSNVDDESSVHDGSDIGEKDSLSVDGESNIEDKDIVDIDSLLHSGNEEAVFKGVELDGHEIPDDQGDGDLEDGSTVDSGDINLYSDLENTSDKETGVQENVDQSETAEEESDDNKKESLFQKLKRLFVVVVLKFKV